MLKGFSNDRLPILSLRLVTRKKADTTRHDDPKEYMLRGNARSRCPDDRVASLSTLRLTLRLNGLPANTPYPEKCTVSVWPALVCSFRG